MAFRIRTLLLILPLTFGMSGCKLIYLLFPQHHSSTPDAGFDAGPGEDAGDAGPMPEPDSGIDSGPDSGPDAGEDGGIDAGIDAGFDAGIDAGFDGGEDGGMDAGHGPCAPNPCGTGTCSTTGGTYVCDCGTDVFDGTTCVTNTCAANGTCEANSTCLLQPHGQNCQCNPGFADPMNNNTCAFVGEVSGGTDLTCAIHPDATLWCWGLNVEYLSSSANEYAPNQVNVTPPETWRHVSVGDGGFCAIATDGTLWCLDTTSNNDLAPSGMQLVRIGTASDWAQVSVGQSFACAVKTDSTAWCWGDDSGGQLGDGNSSRGTNGQPTQLPGNAAWQWKSVSAGSDVACGIQTDDSLWCWGSTQHGHTGTGLGAARIGPTTLLSGQTWQSVSAGAGGCAVKTDGDLWCWGDVATITTPQTAPILIVATAGNIWSSVSTRLAVAGFCATQSNNTLWCQGDDYYGEFGNGITTDSLLPISEVGGSSGWAAVTARTAQTCAIEGTGNLWCWGSNQAGQVGDGLLGASSSMTFVQVTGSGWSSVVQGVSKHMCALKNDHSLWCWGENNSGEIGDGTQTFTTSQNWTYGGGQKAVPTQEKMDASWSSAAVGFTYTCAIRSGGAFANTLWCWGLNTAGQLGIGQSEQSSTSPSEVTPGTAWAQVSTGASHACGIQQNGTLWCWGNGSDGSATASNALAPVQVGTANDWASVSCGPLYSCAIETNGVLSCWGTDDSPLGFLASDPNNVDAAPTPVNADHDWASVFAGPTETCALKTPFSNRALYCWGTGGAAPAQVGTASWQTITNGNDGIWGIQTDGSLWQSHGTTPPIFTQLGSATDWTSVVSSQDNTCATRQDGSLWCEGPDDVGELGDGSAWSTIPVLIFSPGG